MHLICLGGPHKKKNAPLQKTSKNGNLPYVAVAFHQDRKKTKRKNEGDSKHIPSVMMLSAKHPCFECAKAICVAKKEYS
jgi:hypothetical protein